MESENSSETKVCQSCLKTSNQISFSRSEFERTPDYDDHDIWTPYMKISFSGKLPLPLTPFTTRKT